MKKHLALGIAGASAALIAGWQLVRQLVDRDAETTDGVAVAPGIPAEQSPPAKAGPDEASAPEPTGDDTGDKDEPKGGNGPEVTEQTSKTELYEIAQRLEIEGRSKMSKAELLEAIRNAG